MAPPTDAKKPRISDDDRLTNMWLHNRSANTARAYRADLSAFRSWAAKPLAEVVLDDLQAWFDSLPGSDATRRRKLASVKSALAFGCRRPPAHRPVNNLWGPPHEESFASFQKTQGTNCHVTIATHARTDHTPHPLGRL